MAYNSKNWGGNLCCQHKNYVTIKKYKKEEVI